MLQLDAIRQTLAEVLQSAVNVDVRLAFPWIAVQEAQELNLPAFYLVQPDIVIEEDGLKSQTASVRFEIYYVIHTFGVENPTEPLFEIQDRVVSALASTTAFRQYDASVSFIGCNGENRFSSWARLLSKPFEAIAFDVEIQVAMD